MLDHFLQSKQMDKLTEELKKDDVVKVTAVQPNNEEKDLAQQYLEGWQRAKADYANLKRETEGRMQDLVKYANTELLKELLPLVDYFKHALKNLPTEHKGEPWAEGIRHIQSKLEQVLAYYGIRELEVVGERFNPALHEAVGEVENSSESSGTIVEEIRTGFMLHDKLLQAARVKVAK
jgi:molecular chaperone GrpE